MHSSTSLTCVGLLPQVPPRCQQGASNNLSSYVENVIGLVSMLPKGRQGLHIAAAASSCLPVEAIPTASRVKSL